jgi:excisionase family DNA binding protein
MTKHNHEMAPLVFTAGETAALLKVSQKTVYRLVARGFLSSTNHLRHLRITRASLEKFVMNNDGGLR